MNDTALLHDAVCADKQAYGECFGHEKLPPEANVPVMKPVNDEEKIITGE